MQGTNLFKETDEVLALQTLHVGEHGDLAAARGGDVRPRRSGLVPYLCRVAD